MNFRRINISVIYMCVCVFVCIRFLENCHLLKNIQEILEVSLNFTHFFLVQFVQIRKARVMNLERDMSQRLNNCRNALICNSLVWLKRHFLDTKIWYFCHMKINCLLMSINYLSWYGKGFFSPYKFGFHDYRWLCNSM